MPGLLNPTGTFTIKWTSCCTCGCVVAMESTQYDQFIASHKIFYCPNGHGQHFTGKSEAEKRAEKAERDAEWHRQRAEGWQREANVQTHRARGLKAAQTRLKNRIKKGICPQCNRYFENLHRHMTGQHPEPVTQISVLPHDSGGK